MEELISIIKTRQQHNHMEAGQYNWIDESGWNHFNSYSDSYMDNIESLRQLLINEIGEIFLIK